MRPDGSPRPSVQTDVTGGIIHLLAEMGAVVAIGGVLALIAWILVLVY